MARCGNGGVAHAATPASTGVVVAVAVAIDAATMTLLLRRW